MIKNKNLLGFLILLCIILTITVLSGCSGKEADPANIQADKSDSSMEDAELENTSGDIADIGADYILDHENSSIAVSELPIGTRIADLTWTWEYRLGYSYSNEQPGLLEPLDPGETKPVVWIIVAIDHYDKPEPHVTLMAEEVIGRYSFDGTLESARFDDYLGHNHWGNSGTTDSIPGLRPWLNSTGSYSDEGFYQAFTESFRNSIIVTEVPNREWETGDHYYTRDKVFIPSTTELGDADHFYSYQISSTYSYFLNENSDRGASLGSEPLCYWTRTPASYSEEQIFRVHVDGHFYSAQPYVWFNGVRPVVNIRSDVMVSENVE